MMNIILWRLIIFVSALLYYYKTKQEPKLVYLVIYHDMSILTDDVMNLTFACLVLEPEITHILVLEKYFHPSQCDVLRLYVPKFCCFFHLGICAAVFDIGCTNCIEGSPGLNAKVSVDTYFKLYNFCSRG